MDAVVNLEHSLGYSGGAISREKRYKLYLATMGFHNLTAHDLFRLIVCTLYQHVRFESLQQIFRGVRAEE